MTLTVIPLTDELLARGSNETVVGNKEQKVQIFNEELLYLASNRI